MSLRASAGVRQSRVLRGRAQRYPDKLRFVKINVESSPQAARTYAIKTAPTLKLLVDGEVARTIVGATPKSKLVIELEKYI
jgi:thioredoxin-like negative regulator of GroEL